MELSKSSIDGTLTLRTKTIRGLEVRWVFSIGNGPIFALEGEKLLMLWVPWLAVFLQRAAILFSFKFKFPLGNGGSTKSGKMYL